jgi:hypothetical protein
MEDFQATSHKGHKKTIYYIYIQIPGCWYTYPSEKYEFVSWDDDIPIIYGTIKNVPNHQYIYIYMAFG